MADRDFATHIEIKMDIAQMLYVYDFQKKTVAVELTWGKAGEMIVLDVHNTEKVLVMIFHVQRIFFIVFFCTDEHRQLCAGRKISSAPDTTHVNGGNVSHGDYVKVDECSLRPHICGEGDCIDTNRGYECRCKPGFRKGDAQVCEG